MHPGKPAVSQHCFLIVDSSRAVHKKIKFPNESLLRRRFLSYYTSNIITACLNDGLQGSAILIRLCMSAFWDNIFIVVIIDFFEEVLPVS